MTVEHHRHSLRLEGYDYSQNGAYFVTICTHQGVCILARVVDGRCQETRIGQIARWVWEELARHYAVILDEFCIMPNHVHGILFIEEGSSHGLAEIVRGFKSYSAKRINQVTKSGGKPVWQRNYYERVIRNERELNAVREYIRNNPMKWELDQEYRRD
jgi:REP element-mobilizing transposase RayT